MGSYIESARSEHTTGQYCARTLRSPVHFTDITSLTFQLAPDQSSWFAFFTFMCLTSRKYLKCYSVSLSFTYILYILNDVAETFQKAPSFLHFLIGEGLPCAVGSTFSRP